MVTKAHMQLILVKVHPFLIMGLLKSKNIDYSTKNGRKLKYSHWISLQIINNDSICGVTRNNELLCEIFP